jgi:hypothetical protein
MPVRADGGLWIARTRIWGDLARGPLEVLSAEYGSGVLAVGADPLQDLI